MLSRPQTCHPYIWSPTFVTNIDETKLLSKLFFEIQFFLSKILVLIGRGSWLNPEIKLRIKDDFGHVWSIPWSIQPLWYRPLTTILLRWRYYKLYALWGLKLGHSNQKWDLYAVIMRKNDDSKLEICQIKSKSNQCWKSWKNLQNINFKLVIFNSKLILSNIQSEFHFQYHEFTWHSRWIGINYYTV